LSTIPPVSVDISQGLCDLCNSFCVNYIHLQVLFKHTFWFLVVRLGFTNNDKWFLRVHSTCTPEVTSQRVCRLVVPIRKGRHVTLFIARTLAAITNLFNNNNRVVCVLARQWALDVLYGITDVNLRVTSHDPLPMSRVPRVLLAPEGTTFLNEILRRDNPTWAPAASKLKRSRPVNNRTTYAHGRRCALCIEPVARRWYGR